MEKFIIKRKRPNSDNILPNNNDEAQPGPSNVGINPLDEVVTNVTITTSTVTSTSITNTSITSTKKNTYLFSEKWLEIQEFKEWLTSSIKDGNVVAKCKYCQIFLHNHKPHLYRHLETEKHKMLSATISSTSNIKTLLQPTKEKEMAKRGEIKLAAYLAAHNLPFLLCDTLVPLIADICSDSKIAQNMAMGRTKATAVINQILGDNFSKNLTAHLKKPGNFFSVVMDETTDQGSIKQCAITVIFYKSLTVETNFLTMVEMASGTAEDLHNVLKEIFKKQEIPLINLVGFSSDTTNTMVGEHNSVFSKLKETIPHIACIKCSCHMIHLAASKACLKLPRSLEDLLRNVGSHFSRSWHRQQKLLEMQQYFKVEIHKILSPATTRWLSLKSCVDRVLEQYDALEAYFRIEVFEDPSKTNDSIHATLKNNFTKMYLEFMSYVLELFTDFNVLFQTETPLLHKLKGETEKLIKHLASNYMEFQYIKSTPALQILQNNPRYYLPVDKIYIGIQAQATLEEMKKQPNPPPQSEIERALLDCMQFYIEGITQIKKRFDFSDLLFNLIEIVDPLKPQNYNPQNIINIIERFPVLKNFIDENSLIKEWREYCLLDHDIDQNLSAEKYWAHIFNLKDAGGNTKFTNLRKVIGLLLILPFSNASVERLFSKLKRIKTESRTRLHTETLVSLIHTSEGVDKIGGVKKFEPSKEMLNAKIRY